MSESTDSKPVSSERGSSTRPDGGSTADASLPPIPIVPPRRRFWDRGGLSPRAEQRWNVVGGLVLAILAVGWGWSLTHARELSQTSNGEVGLNAVGAVAAALTNRDAPSTAYLTNAALDLLEARMLASE